MSGSWVEERKPAWDADSLGLALLMPGYRALAVAAAVAAATAACGIPTARADPALVPGATGTVG